MDGITLIDASAVGVVVFLVSMLRSVFVVPERYVPLLPFVVALFIGPMTVYMGLSGQQLPTQMLLTKCVWEAVKLAALSMSAYKVAFTTVFNKTPDYKPLLARKATPSE